MQSTAAQIYNLLVINQRSSLHNFLGSLNELSLDLSSSKFLFTQNLHELVSIST